MPIMKAMIMGMNKVMKMVEMATVTVLTMMIQVVTMITMKQSTKKAMKMAMMMDIQKANPNMRMKKNLMKMNSPMKFERIKDRFTFNDLKDSSRYYIMDS